MTKQHLTLPPLGEGARRADEGRSEAQVLASFEARQKAAGKRPQPSSGLSATFSQREKGEYFSGSLP